MSAHPSLRRRIVLGVMCYTVLVAVATSLLGYWVNEQAEQRVWENMLHSALRHELARLPGRQALPAGDTMQIYGQGTGQDVPVEFARLGPGVHDEVPRGDRLYVVAVQEGAADPVVLAMDISEMEHREHSLARVLVLAAVALVVLLAAATYAAARWLVRPLTRLSATIATLRPDTTGQQIDSSPRDPAEVAIITRALNEYLREIDRYVERERGFLNMASHELRTPIAVISGAAELAGEQPTLEQARAHITRISRASRGMRELVSLLLALARDPARLRAMATDVDLGTLLPRLIADHEHLLAGKELTVVCGELPEEALPLPEVIATAAIGNLIRNAIENSDRGTIRISMADVRTLVIQDPGSALSARERSQLQSRLARAGQGHGDGIGLELVTRLCNHLGWVLRLDNAGVSGTTATLRFCAAAMS